ncbi:hypothetical protein PoB_003692700 [Plakobranchus ocellatus]|uniref:G-protein coupled receptors family 1 profile domain-containing protein n=1 Tax=Plakobranchus ocellatus TaxID=259542 RepID=A0AAV4ATX0_9GAST|nr:hypothetical protein PoB_003692700 [Plakobranchus ocellatus]
MHDQIMLDKTEEQDWTIHTAYSSDVLINILFMLVLSHLPILYSCTLAKKHSLQLIDRDQERKGLMVFAAIIMESHLPMHHSYVKYSWTLHLDIVTQLPCCRETSLPAITWFPGSGPVRRYCIFLSKH